MYRRVPAWVGPRASFAVAILVASAGAFTLLPALRNPFFDTWTFRIVGTFLLVVASYVYARFSQADIGSSLTVPRAVILSLGMSYLILTSLHGYQRTVNATHRKSLQLRVQASDELLRSGFAELLTSSLCTQSCVRDVTLTKSSYLNAIRDDKELAYWLPTLQRDAFLRVDLGSAISHHTSIDNLSLITPDGRSSRIVTTPRQLTKASFDSVVTAICRSVSADTSYSGFASELCDSPEANLLYVLGLQHYYQRTSHDLQLAKGLFRRALVLSPSFNLAEAGLADVFSISYLCLWDTTSSAVDSARVHAERAVQINPNSAASHKSLGLSIIAPVARAQLSDQGAFDRQAFDLALKETLRALSIDPGYYPAYVNLISLNGVRHRTNEARLIFDQLVTLRADYVYGYIALADVLLQEGDARRARGLYEAALQRRQDVGAVYFGLFRCECREGDAQGAMRMLALAKQCGDANYDAIIQLDGELSTCVPAFISEISSPPI